MLWWSVSADLVGKNANGKTSSNVLIVCVLTVIIYSTILGLRFEVGVDFNNYVNYYEYQSYGLFNDSIPYEIGFYVLINVLSFFELPPQALFVSTCALQMSFICYWLSRHRNIAPWFVFFLFTTLFIFESLNLVRQALALSIILVALDFRNSKNPLAYFSLVALACSFHLTAAIFIPLYFFIGSGTLSRATQIGVLCLSYVVAFSFGEYVLRSIALISIVPFYSRYAEIQDGLLLAQPEGSFGLGIFFVLIVHLTLIYFNRSIRAVVNDSRYDTYFKVFYFGALLFPFAEATNYIPIFRLVFGFLAFKPVVLAYAIKALPRSSVRNQFSNNLNLGRYLLALLICFAYLLWFFRAMLAEAARCCPFRFIWQGSL